jgi:Fur family transcriptional regulator, ferric uptake regulator
VSEDWIERAEREMASGGRKRGGARRAVLELLGSEPCALSVQEIERELQLRDGRGASRASIYRVLDELERLRLVARVETGQQVVRYERAGGHEHHHHHLVCDRCGLIRPFSDLGLERAIARLSERVPLAVSEHEIVLRGACPGCAETLAAPPTGS